MSIVEYIQVFVDLVMHTLSVDTNTLQSLGIQKWRVEKG